VCRLLRVESPLHRRRATAASLAQRKSRLGGTACPFGPTSHSSEGSTWEAHRRWKSTSSGLRSWPSGKLPPDPPVEELTPSSVIASAFPRHRGRSPTCIRRCGGPSDECQRSPRTTRNAQRARGKRKVPAQTLDDRADGRIVHSPHTRSVEVRVVLRTRVERWSRPVLQRCSCDDLASSARSTAANHNESTSPLTWQSGAYEPGDNGLVTEVSAPAPSIPSRRPRL
jgi:hypothetical protein